jgi:hypothetical protein
MKQFLIRSLMILGLLAPSFALAADGKVGAGSPASVTVIGADDGSGNTMRLKGNPSTGYLPVEVVRVPPFYGAGISADTTAKAAGTPTQLQGFDVDSAPWTTAYLFKHKALELTINNVGGATTGMFVFRIQGSYTGTSSSWTDITLPTFGGVGAATSMTDTLQFVFVASTAGASPGTRRLLPLDTYTNAAFYMWQNPLNAFAQLRCVVQNRSNGTSALDYTVKFMGNN